MRRPSLKILNFPNEATSKARGGGSREAIVEAAERLFLQRGFGSVTMDELAEAAGVAQRTLYKQGGDLPRDSAPAGRPAKTLFRAASKPRATSKMCFA